MDDKTSHPEVLMHSERKSALKKGIFHPFLNSQSIRAFALPVQTMIPMSVSTKLLFLLSLSSGHFHAPIKTKIKREKPLATASITSLTLLRKA